MNTISHALAARCEGTCELCAAGPAVTAYTVSPKSDHHTDHQVALCSTCSTTINEGNADSHWQCLAGSIWNTSPVVQALSYRICYQHKDESWAEDILNSVELDESTINWALTAFEVAAMHRDSNGAELTNGDTVVLTQSLNIKGTSFSAPKGTIVRKIRLVSDNTEHIEGKINNQTIVILTKFVRRSS